MLKIEKVKEKISQMDESEAKSLLLIMYAKLDTAINGIGGDEIIKQTVNDLYEMYSELVNKHK